MIERDNINFNFCFNVTMLLLNRRPQSLAMSDDITAPDGSKGWFIDNTTADIYLSQTGNISVVRYGIKAAYEAHEKTSLEFTDLIFNEYVSAGYIEESSEDLS